MSVDLDSVPPLKRVQVEHTANLILKAAEHQLREKLTPPIDPEIIADNFLGLSLVYCDMIGKYEFDDLNGGLIISEKLILIEESQVDVRVNFTIGHEIGHWILHRELVEIPNPNQSSLFNETNQELNESNSTMLCRASNNRTWGERQADWFSAALLMPSQFVREAFQKVSKHPYSFKRKTLDSFIPGNHGSTTKTNTFQSLDDEWRILDIVDKVKDAGNFKNVSDDAMRIRLQQFQLIVPEDEPKPVF